VFEEERVGDPDAEKEFVAVDDTVTVPVTE